MITREDLYLKKLNDSTVDTPTPVTNKEKILADLAGTNGLGVELPSITSSDNGKVLTVNNGQWALGQASGGSGAELQIVTITPGENGEAGTCTHSSSELRGMLQNDIPFIIICNGIYGAICNYSTYGDSSSTFRAWCRCLYVVNPMENSMDFMIQVFDINENKEVYKAMAGRQTVTVTS